MKNSKILIVLTLIYSFSFSTSASEWSDLKKFLEQTSRPYDGYNNESNATGATQSDLDFAGEQVDEIYKEIILPSHYKNIDEALSKNDKKALEVAVKNLQYEMALSITTSYAGAFKELDHKILLALVEKLSSVINENVPEDIDHDNINHEDVMRYLLKNNERVKAYTRVVTDMVRVQGQNEFMSLKSDTSVKNLASAFLVSLYGLFAFTAPNIFEYANNEVAMSYAIVSAIAVGLSFKSKFLIKTRYLLQNVMFDYYMHLEKLKDKGELSEQEEFERQSRVDMKAGNFARNYGMVHIETIRYAIVSLLSLSIIELTAPGTVVAVMTEHGSKVGTGLLAFGATQMVVVDKLIRNNWKRNYRKWAAPAKSLKDLFSNCQKSFK